MNGEPGMVNGDSFRTFHESLFTVHVLFLEDDMGRVYARVILAAVVAVAVSVGLYVYLVQSPYIFALGLALGCYIAQLSTFKDGLLFGSATSFLPALVMAAVGVAPADSDEAVVGLSAILIVILGALYCGAITWLIQRLKNGKVIYS